MSRRCPITLAVLTAALVLAGRPTTTYANGVTTYSLTNTSGGPIDDIGTLVTPAGSLATTESPLTIIPQGSSGFASDNCPSRSSTGTSPDPASPGDIIGIAFTGDGSSPGFSTKPFQANGVFNFSLNLAPGYTGTPQLTLIEPPRGSPSKWSPRHPTRLRPRRRTTRPRASLNRFRSRSGPSWRASASCARAARRTATA